MHPDVSDASKRIKRILRQEFHKAFPKGASKHIQVHPNANAYLKKTHKGNYHGDFAKEDP